jgi:hypothetical protein
LFACACARRHWDLLPDDSCRRAVEVSEQFADGQVSQDDLERAWTAASRLAEAAVSRLSRWDMLAWTKAEARDAARRGAWAAAHSVTADTPSSADHRAESDILREIFGNPFQSHTGMAEPTSTLRQLAQEIYQQRSFDRLPILADALEEAGCTNADILSHCRQPGEHVRGCWVIDLLTGCR